MCLLLFFLFLFYFQLMAEIPEVLHGLALLRKLTHICLCLCKIVFPEFFGMLKGFLLIWSWFICLLILHHLNGLSQLSYDVLFYCFWQISMENLWGKVYALLFRWECVQQKFMLTVSILSWCKKLRHQKLLCLHDLIFDIVSNSILGYLQQVILYKDRIVVVLFDSLKWMKTFNQ